MKRLWDNIEAIGAVVMALAAVIALVYAHVQITEGRDAERRSDARDLWRESVRVAFDYPHLRTRRSSSPTLTMTPRPSTAAPSCFRNTRRNSAPNR
jgi:hypothetical protein